MLEQFQRTQMLIGEEGLEKLSKAKIAIFGIGGVGSYVAEGLIRVGITNFILVDNDVVDITNINRQIHATTNTIGQDKVEVMKKRMLEINKEAKIQTYKTFYLPENEEKIIDRSITYVVDAIDTVSAKIGLVQECNILNIPIISCMGTGNKLNPTMLEVSDINKTTVCPLAKTIRKELRKTNIKKLKVVYSKEEPIKKLTSPGSVSFVPSVAGMIITSEVVKDILNLK